MPPMAQRIEVGTLLAFAFVVPLFEAPKNLLWLAYVAIWIVNRWRTRDFGGPWDRWDTLIVLWIASGFASAVFAGIHHEEYRAAADIVRYGGVLWLLKRSRYPDRAWIQLAIAIVAGTVVALAWGYAVLPKTHLQLQMNSVGHVNHSAIYLAIVLGLAVAATRAWWSTSGWGLRALGLALLAALAISLQWMESRGAIGAAFLMAAVLLGVEAVRQRRRLRFTALLVLAAVVAVLAIKPTFIEKNLKFMEAGKFLNVREGTWRVGLSAWREYPLFGVGMDNYARIRPEDVQAWSAKRGEAYDRDALLFTHGHSLYVTALTERGLVGLAVLLAVLVAWAVAWMRAVPGAQAPPLHWTYWGGAAGAWLITVVVGVVNTTLHHEHALVATLLLGGWLSLDRNRAT
jgi:O-antigen ligase